MKTKNNITELVFILDRSGSMCGLESDTIGGFNSLIKKQKKIEGKAYVSTILFDDKSVVLHDRVDLKSIKLMSEKDYEVGGCTALLDALGGAIDHISGIHKYIREEDVPNKTMFIIITDGMENASHIYSSGRVKDMISAYKENNGWEFLFIGANIDAVETAKNFGIDSDRAVNYNADEKGTEIIYDTISETVCACRMSEPISPTWCEKIENDFENRKQNK